MDALRLDRKFFACYYNLGIVYSRLEDGTAAEAAFRRAIATDPDNVAAYLGLAQIYDDRHDRLRTRIWATKALGLAPHNARAWNLLGVASASEIREGRDAAGSAGAPSPGAEPWGKVVEIFEAAAAYAWRALSRSELTDGPARDAAHWWVTISFANLSEALFEHDRPLDGASISREALLVEPREPLLHLALGRNLAAGTSGVCEAPSRRILEEALSALYRAEDDGLGALDRCQRWLWIVRVRQSLEGLEGGDRGQPGAELLTAFRCFLDAVVAPEELILASSGRAAKRLAEEYRRQIDEIVKYLEEHHAVQGSSWRFSTTNLLRLVRVLRDLEVGTDAPAHPKELQWQVVFTSDRCWVAAQWLIRKARVTLLASEVEKPVEAARELEVAIRCLRHDHSRQIRRQGLKSLLARAYWLEAERQRNLPLGASPGVRIGRVDCLRKALENAQSSLAANPESPGRRLVMSQVHAASRDYDLAAAEQKLAFNLGLSVEMCGDERILAGLESAWKDRFSVARDPATRGAILATSKRQLERLLALLVSTPRSEEDGERFADHAALHLALGRLEIAAERWPQAVYHLRIASCCGARAVEAHLLLGRALAAIGLLDGAAAAFEEAIAVAEGTPPAAPVLLAEAEIRKACCLVRRGGCRKEARELLVRAEKRFPEPDGLPTPLRALLAQARGELDLEAGRWAEAIGHFREAVAADPSVEAWRRLAEVLLAQGRPPLRPKSRETALRVLEAARRWHGDSPLPRPLAALEETLRAHPPEPSGDGAG